MRRSASRSLHSTRRTALFFGAVMGLLSVASASGQRAPTLGDDVRFLRAVVRAVSDTVREGLLIDPRLLRIDASTDAAVSQLRRLAEHTPSTPLTKVLTTERVPSGDVFVEVACAGVLAPPVDSARNRGCPTTTYTVVAFSRPWRVDKKRQVATRVLVRRYSSQGQSVTWFDYIFEQKAGDWILVARKARGILE